VDQFGYAFSPDRNGNVADRGLVTRHLSLVTSPNEGHRATYPFRRALKNALLDLPNERSLAADAASNPHRPEPLTANNAKSAELAPINLLLCALCDLCG
jgi:hypothetical protein